MWGNRYFAARYFGDRYWGPFEGSAFAPASVSSGVSVGALASLAVKYPETTIRSLEDSVWVPIVQTAVAGPGADVEVTGVSASTAPGSEAESTVPGPDASVTTTATVRYLPVAEVSATVRKN